MLSSNGRRVFVDNKSSLTCYDFNVETEQWNTFGANFASGFKQDGKVVKNSQNNHIGFSASKGGNVVVAHKMGTQNIEIFKYSLKTKIWKKIQTISSIEPDNSESGSYAIDNKGENFVLFVKNSSNSNDLYYYALNTSTGLYDNKFTINSASGITNEKSILQAKMNGDGTRFIIGDTNGNIFNTINDNGNGVVKVYDVTLSNYSYSLNSTLTSSNDESLFGNALSINKSGNRIAISEPLEHKYYVYDYDENTSSWSIPTGFTLDSADNTSSRYNNVIEFNKLGDALFIGEYDDAENETGLVFGYYYDNSNSSWEEYQTLSGEFYDADASGAINQFSSSTTFTDSYSFGSLLSVSDQGTTLLVGCHHLANVNNNDNALIIKDPVASTKTFTNLGLSGEAIIQLGLSPKELVDQGGLTISEMKTLNVSANTLLVGGKTELELYNNNYTICEIATAETSDLSGLINDNSANVSPLDFLECDNVTVSSLLTKGITKNDLLEDISSSGDISLNVNEFKLSGFTSTELNNVGVSLKDLLLGGYTSTELVSSGFTVNQLKSIELSASDLKKSGLNITDLSGDFNASDLLLANFADSDFTNSGYTVEATKTVEQSIGAVTFSQEVKSVIKNDNVNTLTTSLPNEDTLKNFLLNNPSVTNMLSITAADSNGDSIYDISSGPVALTLDFPDLDPNENNVLCKYDSSHNLMNPQPNGYPSQLIYDSNTGKYTTSLTNLSNTAPMSSDSAPDGSTRTPTFYIYNKTYSSGSVISSYTGSTNITLELLLPQYMRTTDIHNSIRSKWNLSNCWIKSITKSTPSQNSKPKGSDYNRLKTITQTYSNFDGVLPTGTRSRIADGDVRPGWDVKWQLRTYELYIIVLKINTGLSLGTEFYIENKNDTQENKIYIDGYGYIEDVQRFSMRYDVPQIPAISHYRINNPANIYLHEYQDSTGNTIKEYYLNQAGKITFQLFLTNKITSSLIHNKSDGFTFKNCTFVQLNSTQNKNNFSIQVNTVLDLMSETGTTVVSISMLKDSLLSSDGSSITGPIEDDEDAIVVSIDTVPPTLTISSPDISSNGYWVNGTLNILLTADENIRTMQADYFDIQNATIESIKRKEGTYNTYTAILIPTIRYADIQISIQLKSETIMDFGGNLNVNKSNTFIWNYDGIAPHILSMSSSDISSGDSYKDDDITIDIEFNENITDLSLTDFTVTNGSVSNLQGSNKTYSLTLSPSDTNTSNEIRLVLPANSIKDTNNLSNLTDSSPFIWNYDITKPVITLSSEKANNASTNDAIITYTIFSTKSLKTISTDSFEVSNATIYDVIGSGQNYTVKLSPLSNAQTTLIVKANGVTDITNNQNDLSSNQYNWTYDSDKPIVTIISSDVDLNQNASSSAISVDIKVNDSNIDLLSSYLTVNGGGSITNFEKNNVTNIHTCTFTASSPYTENTLQIAENEFTDGAGNSNNASNIFTWKWNKAKPSIQITSTDISSGGYSNDNVITLLFTPSEDISPSFIIDDISCNGVLSNFESSGDNYVVSLRPIDTNAATITAVVPSGTIKDTYDYVSTQDSNTFTWNYDGTVPTITITSDEMESGDNNNLTEITVKIELSKALPSLSISNFTVIAASLSEFTKINDLLYTSKLTVSTLNVLSIVQLYMSSGAITDIYGNENTESNKFIWNSDTLPPRVVSMAAFSGGKSYYSNVGYKYTKGIYNGLWIKIFFNKKIQSINNSSFVISDTVDGEDNHFDFKLFNLNNIGTKPTNVYKVRFLPQNYNTNNYSLMPDYTKGSIHLREFSIIDEYGNTNDISSAKFTIIRDVTNPKITLSAVNMSDQSVTSNSTTNDEHIYLDIRSSKKVVEHLNNASAINLTNCTQGEGQWVLANIIYRIKITPIDRSLSTSVSIASELFKDKDNNALLSEASTESFTWTSDINSPIMTITSPHVEDSQSINTRDISFNLSFDEALSSDLEVSDLSYTNGSIITNSFSGSGTSYSLSFQADVNGGNTTIYLPSNNTVTDSVGNSSISNIFTWIYSVNRPTLLSFYSDDISSGDYTNNSTITLKFQSSTQVLFDSSKFGNYISNGILLLLSTGDDKNFEAIIEVEDYESITDSFVQITIPKDAFYETLTDGTKIYNDATYDFSFNYMDIIPQLNMFSSSIEDGATTNSNSIELLFQEPNSTEIYNFNVNDLIVYPDNSAVYYIDNFVGSDGSSNFSATLNASQDGDIVVSLPTNSYNNKVGQSNTENKLFTWKRDSADVSLVIYSDALDSGSSSVDSSLSIIFESNKIVKKTDVQASVDISNATMMPLSGDTNGKIFKTTLIPITKNVQSSIFVNNNTISDSAGNINSNVSNTFYWTFTGDNPTVSLNTTSSVTNGSISALSELSMNIVITGDTVTLQESNITTTNASIENFTHDSTSGDTKTYTFNFVPDVENTESTIVVPGGVFQDSFGVSNIESSLFSYTYNDNPPTIVVSSSSIANNGKSKQSHFDFDFEFSTNVDGFTLGDIEVSGGTFDTLINKGNNKFGSRLTPNTNDGTITVNIPENKVTHSITDVSNTVSNTYTIDYDTNKMNLEISSNIVRGSSNNTYNVEMTITSNKDIVDFSKDKLTSNNCTIYNEKQTSASVYQIFVNPINNDTVSVNIPEGIFHDAYGNSNNEVSGGAFEWIFDTSAVFINLTSDDLPDVSGSVKNIKTINFVANVNDDNEDLVEDDLSYSNLSIESFSKRAGTSIYDIEVKAIKENIISSFMIPSDVIQDAANNYNLETTSFSWLYDTSLPEITISSTDISSEGSTNTSSIDLVFTLSEAVQSFNAGNVSITNASIQSGSFQKISDTVYNATLVANTEYNGLISVQVKSGEIEDVGNSENTASNIFIWNCDTVAPQYVLGFSNNEYSNGLILEETSVSIKSTVINGEDVSFMSIDDFTVTNGTLSNFVQDSSYVYSFDFTATTANTASTIYVPSSQFSDSAGNSNTQSNTLSWTYYDKPLTIESISSNVVEHNGITNVDKIRVSFSLSEVATNLAGTTSLIELTNARFDNDAKLVRSSDTGKDYSIDLIVDNANNSDNPSLLVIKQNVNVNINANGFSITKNVSASSSNLRFSWVYDNVNPTLSIYSDSINNNDITNDASINVIFESSKDISGSTFTSSDIVVLDGLGTITDLSGSGKTYNATLTPNDISNGSIVVKVNPGSFTDTVGNLFEGDVSFNWNYDALPPTVEISSNVASGSSNSNSYLDISFILSESIKEDFIEKFNDIVTLTNATVTDLSGSGTTYYGKLNSVTPDSESKLVIIPNKITDLAGNLNDTSSNEYTWTYDGEDVVLTLTSDDVSASGYHKNNSITVKLSASSTITSSFTTSNISVQNGSVSNLSNTDSGAGLLWEFTITSTTANTATVVTIAEDEVYSNANPNLVSKFTWTYDNIKPTISISGERINGNSILTNAYNNDSYIKLLFNTSEDVSFGSSNINLSNGTISNFRQLETKKYSAHLHPSSVGQVSALIPANEVNDIAENYNEVSSNTFVWNYDNVSPTINIYSNDISDNGSSDVSSVTLIIEASEPINGLSQASFTVKNSIIDSLSGSDGDISYSLVLKTNDFNNNQNATIKVSKNTITDLALNSNTVDSNTFNITFNKRFIRRKDVSELKTIFENDTDINNNDIPSTTKMDTIVSTLVDTINDTDGVEIAFIDASMNRKIYKRLMEQMFERNTKKKLRMKRDNIPIKASTLQILKNNSRSKIVVADSNQSVNYSDLASTSSTDEGIFVPLSSINDYVELTINNGEKFKFIQTSADVYKMEKYNSGGAKVTEETYDEDDSFTYLGYTFIFGGVTGYYNPPDGEDSSSNVIPCFLKDTMILTTNGYKSIQDIKPGKDMLVDYEGKSLKCLEIKGFNQKFDNEHFPYVVPKGSQIGTTMKCVKDLYLTYNHCIYMPHMDKFVPSYRMNLQQDKTKVEDYTYYHIFTENYFSDIIIANGVPCETHSKYVLKSIKSIDNSGKLLYTLYQHCGAENDGLRKRIEPKMFNKIVKKFSKKNKKKNSKVQK